jgi:hypothetical protein
MLATVGCASSATATAAGTEPAADPTLTTASAAGTPAATPDPATRTAAGATPSASAATPGAQPDRSGGSCLAAGLSVSAVSGGDGSGHSALILRFTNHTAAPCSLRGYPAVALMLPGGEKIEARRTPHGYMGGDSGGTPLEIVLAPAATVSALLEWAHFPGDGEAKVNAADCSGYRATGLLVTAPGSTTPSRLPAPDSATPVCRGFEVHPIVTGLSGRGAKWASAGKTVTGH